MTIKNWKIVDEHSDESALNDANNVATFNTKEVKAFYRYIRLRQTGKRWANNYDSEIKNIEFYGKMKL